MTDGDYFSICVSEGKFEMTLVISKYLIGINLGVSFPKSDKSSSQ